MAVQRLSNSGRSGFSYKSLIAGITPLPSVPTIGAATAVNFESVNVSFTAPGAYAGSTYTATSSPGGLTGTSASSPILVSGLSESTAYTFTVTATNATGTSGASAASDSVTTPTGDLGVMFSLGMVQVGSAGLSPITFTSIPSTYKHLQLRGIARTSSAERINLTFNGDTANNYTMHRLMGNGTAVAASAQTSQAAIWVGSGYDGVSQTTDTFTAFVIDILDYTSTTKTKTLRAFDGLDKNGSGGIELSSGLWFKTPEAITSISMSIQSGTSFAQYTQFALYGIKGA